MAHSISSIGLRTPLSAWNTSTGGGGQGDYLISEIATPGVQFRLNKDTGDLTILGDYLSDSSGAPPTPKREISKLIASR